MNEAREHPEREYKMEQLNNCMFKVIKGVRQFYTIVKYSKKENNMNTSVKGIEDLWNEIENDLNELNKILTILNKGKIISISPPYKYFINTDKINNSIRLYYKINLQYIIYTQLINFHNNYLITELVNQNLKIANISNMGKYLNFIYQKIEDKNIINVMNVINSKIKEFINNDFKDYSRYRNDNNKNNNSDIQYNFEICQNEIVQIHIQFWIFNLMIRIPYESVYTKKLIYKMKVFLNYKYRKPSPLLNEEFDLPRKKTNFSLITKLRNIFEFLIIRIFFVIIEEKKYSKEAKETINDIFLELSKRFLYHISDYKDMTKTKCGLCNKIVKYSVQEKCFFPPYYKKYKEEFRDRYNPEENSKLFYHEECFKQIANSCK